MSSSEEYETDEYYPSHDSGIGTPADVDDDDYDATKAGSRRCNAPRARAQPKTRSRAGAISRAGTRNNGGARKIPRWTTADRSSSSSSSEDDDFEDKEYSTKRTARTKASNNNTVANAKVKAKRNNSGLNSGSDSDSECTKPKDEVKKPISISSMKKSNASNGNTDSSSDDDDDPFAHLSQFDSKRKDEIFLSSGSEDDSADSLDFKTRNGPRGRKNDNWDRSGGKRSLCSSDSDDSHYAHRRGKGNFGSSKTTSATAAKKKHNMRGDSDDSDDSFKISSKLQCNNTSTGARAPRAKYSQDLSDSDENKQNHCINGSSLASSKTRTAVKTTPSSPRRNPTRRTKTPSSIDKKPAAISTCSTSVARDKAKATTKEEVEILSLSDDDKNTSGGNADGTYYKQTVTITHNPSVRATSNAALEKAKAARERLRKAQTYHAEDIAVESPEVNSLVTHHGHGYGTHRQRMTSRDVVDLEGDQNSFSTSHGVGRSTAPSAQAPTASANTTSYHGPIISVSLRYQGLHSNKEIKSTFKIKMDEPFQHLVDRFRAVHSTIPSSLNIGLNFDGQDVDLTKNPHSLDMEDEDLMDVTIKGKVAHSFFMNRAQPMTTSDEETLVLLVRRQGRSSHHTFQLRKTDPLSKLVEIYVATYHLPSVTLAHNGRALSASKSPQEEGIPNSANLDAIIPQGEISALGTGRWIKLKFRFNGDDEDVSNISIPSLGTFESAMKQFAEKKNVAITDCKFMFDGDLLQPKSNPQELELEGNEIIDVTLISRTGPPPLLRDDDGDVIMMETGTSSFLLPPIEEITIETNRNCNKLPRQKKWKLLNLDPLSKLKDDYVSYYKSKGCNRVQFYFKHELIQDESKLMYQLGILTGATVYALENGKKYISPI